MAAESQTGGDPRWRGSDDDREWVPREITEGPPYVFERRRPDHEAPAPFERSKSRLHEGLGDLSGAESEHALELRLRQAKERGSELERRIRAAEQRVARALRAVDKNALEVKTIFSAEPEKPTEHRHTKGTATAFNSFE
jgi:hypothetical protein